MRKTVWLVGVALLSALLFGAMAVGAQEPVWELTFEDEADLEWLRIAEADGTPLPAAEHAELSISDEVGGFESRHALKIERKNNDGAYIMIGLDKEGFPFPDNDGGYYEIAFYDPYPTVWAGKQSFVLTGGGFWGDIRFRYNEFNPGQGYYLLGFWDGKAWDDFLTVKRHLERADEVAVPRTRGWHTFGIEVIPGYRTNYYLDRTLVASWDFGSLNLAYFAFWMSGLTQEDLDAVARAGYEPTRTVYVDAIRAYESRPF